MTKCRPVFVFCLLFLWTAIPALACLPSATMTQAEVACCKKMAGDCRMGMGQHPCCKTKVERATPVATLDRSAIRIHPSFVAALLAVSFSPELTIERAGSNELRGLPPPAPPALHPVLRI